MTPVEERIDHAEIRKRLTLWLEDAGMHSRYHRPYANPSELRADIQALLTEHSAREEALKEIRALRRPLVSNEAASIADAALCDPKEIPCQ